MGLWVILLLISLSAAQDLRPQKSSPSTQPAQSRPKIPIIVSRETTYLTGPLNADGTVNYVAAINEMASKGVTPEDNAAIPLIQSKGDIILEPEMTPLKDNFYKTVGMTIPTGDRRYVALRDYLKNHDRDALVRIRKLFPPILRDGLDEGDLPLSDDPAIASWLKFNDGHFTLLARAARRDRYFVPLISSSDPPTMCDTFKIGICLPHVAPIRALGYRARLRLKSGDTAGAFEDAVTLGRLGRMKPQNLMGFLVLASHLSQAASVDEAFARTPDLSTVQLKECLSRIEVLSANERLAEVLDQGERLVALDILVMSSREGLVGFNRFKHELLHKMGQPACHINIPEVAIDWNVVLKLENKYFDDLVWAARLPLYSARVKALEKLCLGNSQAKPIKPIPEDSENTFGFTATCLEMKTLLEKMKDRNPQEVGAAVWQQVMPIGIDLSRTLKGVTEQVQVKQELARVALALRLYNWETGRYPEILNVLVPSILKKVPVDPFSDKPLHYARSGKGFILYSVGPDMKDDGGKEKDPKQSGFDGYDIVLRVE